MDRRTPEQHASAVARRQHGVIAYGQALASGLSDYQVWHLARSQQWARRVRGVFTVAGSPDTAMQRAWVAALAVRDAGGVLSHVSAAAILGLVTAPTLPQVTVPRSSSARCPAAKVHRSDVRPADRTIRDGLAITSCSRTLVDLAGVLAAPSLAEMVDDAMSRRLVTAGTVRAAVERVGRGRRGTQCIRTLVAVWDERISPDSVAEGRLLRMLDDLGLDGIVTQHRVVDDRGGFVAKLDLAVPARRVGLEYDGRRHHGPRQWERDEGRYERLRALGWEVEAVSKLDLLPGEPRLRDLVRRWTSRRAA